MLFRCQRGFKRSSSRLGKDRKAREDRLGPDQGGALRIYRPGLDPRARGPREAGRHRYIPRGRLASTPPEELLAEIAEQVVRDVPLEDPEREPVALEEVEARLARRAFHASERLEEEREAAPHAAEAAPPAGALDAAVVTAALRTLPCTPAELRLASHLYPHRLRVTDRARKAAGEASADDTAMAWRVLVAMAEELHPLHFDGAAEGRSALEIREAFRDRTRFDVAFTESKPTKASPRLRALRTLAYEGEEVELRWHVKWGSRPPKLLRVYYHPDPERRLLVIDWFGDHLETAGTWRM